MVWSTLNFFNIAFGFENKKDTETERQVMGEGLEGKVGDGERERGEGRGGGSSKEDFSHSN